MASNLIPILLLSIFISAAASDTDACGKEIVYRAPSISEDSILQQLLLTGFRSAEPKGVNSYSSRRGGFNSEGGSNRQCITVTYNITCGENTTTICDQCEIQSNNSSQRIYLWTTFNGSSTTGNLLLKLNVFDLRVFGFELCDVYNNQVDLDITLESPEPISPGCYDLNAALIEFTPLLPGLSGELGSKESDDRVPDPAGYAIRWCDDNYLVNNVDIEIKAFSILLVFTSKFFIILFCYELYHQLRDNGVHEKTDNWYYIYWATQFVIIVGMGFLIQFAHYHQKNQVAVQIFYGSIGTDGILSIIAMMLLIAIEKYKHYTNHQSIEAKIKELGKTGTMQNQGRDPNSSKNDTMDLDLVPPPLEIIWRIVFFFFCKMTLCCTCKCIYSSPKAAETTPLIDNNKKSKRKIPLTSRLQSLWKIILNGLSLFTFLALLSYLTQAVPSIAISYYLRPTASLIRLGFYELMILVLIGESAYLLFLFDKFWWLIYVHHNGTIPEEILEKNNEHNDKYDKSEHNTSDDEHSKGSEGHGRINEDNSKADTTTKSTSDKKIKYIDRYLVDTKNLQSPKLIPLPFTRKSQFSLPCTELCHWLFVLTFLQLISFGLVMYVSWRLLHFILIVILEQTSNQGTGFNEILAILPTIAVNMWLLFKKGNIEHILKDVASKIVKSTMEYYKSQK